MGNKQKGKIQKIVKFEQASKIKPNKTKARQKANRIKDKNFVNAEDRFALNSDYKAEQTATIKANRERRAKKYA